MLRMPNRDPRSPSAAGDGAPPELDLLVAPDDMRALAAEVEALGFRRLPSWGHAPHRFFVSRKGSRHGWLKLDVVPRLRYGRPVRCLELAQSTSDVLARRTWDDGVPTRAAEDEFVQLLLHGMLDKPIIAERHRNRLKKLAARFRAEPELAEAASVLFERELAPALTFGAAVEAVRGDRWEELYDRRKAVAFRLFRNAPLLTLGRLASTLCVRRLRPLLRAVARREHG